MPDHYVAWLVGVVAGCAATIAVAVATRVRRFLTPFAVLAFTITGVTAFIYGGGAPAWVVYLGGIVALLVVLGPLAVWEDRHQ